MKEGLNLEDLERTATILVWNGQRFVYHDEDFEGCHLEIDALPNVEILDRILDSVGRQAKEASRVETPFDRIVPAVKLWWQGSTNESLRVPLGRAGARKIQYMELGQGMAQHALVVGKTGAGKSTLLHTLLTGLVLNYSPYEAELYLVDFKKGVEFKTYAVHKLPHARVIAIESEREFGLSVLQGLNSELNRRGELFRTIAVDHISDYRQKSAERLPRILLVVDEFQEFFVEDDAIASRASQILDRLVRQGRAFGIHVLLGSQTLAGTYSLARSTVDQMAVRIALQCSEADSRLILAEDNPAARLLSRPGEAIYNTANGLVEGNSLFQVAWLPDEKHNAYLRRIQEMAQDSQYVPPYPQVIFEGNAPAEVSKNSLFSDLLAAPSWPTKSSQIAVWLGEPIAIKEPTAAYFTNQSMSNLLIVGRNDEAVAGIMLISLISLASQCKPEDVEFYFLNFSRIDASYVSAFTNLNSLVPHSVQIGGRRHLPEVINKVEVEVKKRMNSEVPLEERGKSIFIIVFGLQHARDLRQEEYSYPPRSGEHVNLSLAEQFNTILQEGPDVGVHTLVWCDTYENLTRTLDRRSLREFGMRVIFQMSAEDSTNLVDSPVANKLGPYRVLYFDEEEGRLEKLRPYGLPVDDWFAWVGKQFEKKEGGISSV